MLKLPTTIYINISLFLLILLVALAGGMLLVKNLNAQIVTEEEDKLPPLINEIKISEVTGTSSVITWTTDEMADSLVNYGLDKNYGVVREPRYDKTDHNVILENLLPGMTYYFRITSTDAGGNQGISSDYSFITPKDEEPISTDKEGYAEEVIEEGAGGLSVEGTEQILQAIQNITSEQILEIISEQIQSKAEEIVSPPTIILDYADVQVGTDWAIITWKTDKESNTIVALAEEAEYDESAEDPYRWKEGEPDELVLEHTVEITGLKPATVYHFQVSSKSSLDLTGASSDKTFKTKSILPEIYNIRITKIEEESATLGWSTNVPCSAIIEYTNLNISDTKLAGNSSFLTNFSMKLENLIFDTYYSAIIMVESEDGEKSESEPLTFITTRDEYPPVIAKVNTESTLYPGTENKIQTIMSWSTDEQAQCELFYHQGINAADEPDALPKEEDFATKHVQVVTNFLPSSVYKFWIVCNDEAQNFAKSDDFTMLTPTQEESIIDIIIKNFESSFGWVKKIGG